MALSSALRPTSSGIMACRAGPSKQKARPVHAAAATRCQNAIIPIVTRIAISRAMTAWKAWDTCSSPRFGTRSAMAPPRREKSNRGIPKAKLTIPT